MNQVFNFNGNNVSTALINGEPYFNLKDCCNILGIKNHKDSLSRLNPKGVGTTDHLTRGGFQKATFINESNFYKLVFQSRKPMAENFADWVTSEVLPSIRKHGMYATDELLDNPDFLIATVQKLKEEREQRKALEVKMEEQKPLVSFANAVSTSEDSILIGDFAKLMAQNGVKIGQNRLFEWLRQKGFLISRKGDSWNMPKQEYLDKGLFEVKESTVKASGGLVKLYRTTKITGKGQVYFSDLILNDDKLSSL